MTNLELLLARLHTVLWARLVTVAVVICNTPLWACRWLNPHRPGNYVIPTPV